jgi:hypothetical protein
MMAPTVERHLRTAQQLAELLDATLAKIEGAAAEDFRLVQAARVQLILPLQNALFDLTHLPASVLALTVDSEPGTPAPAEIQAIIAEALRAESDALADLEQASTVIGKARRNSQEGA